MVKHNVDYKKYAPELKREMAYKDALVTIAKGDNGRGDGGIVGTAKTEPMPGKSSMDLARKVLVEMGEGW